MKSLRCGPSLAAMFVLGVGISFGAVAHTGAATASSTTHAISPSPVTITFRDPHRFTESLQSGFGRGFDHDGYLEKLKTYLIKQATPMLKSGQHLAITFTNIDLAGGYEPWRGPNLANVRFMTNAYPPRFDFTFKLTGADGELIRQGTRKLTDLGYLQDGTGLLSDSDPLRYDKALLRRWLRRGPAKW